MLTFDIGNCLTLTYQYCVALSCLMIDSCSYICVCIAYDDYWWSFIRFAHALIQVTAALLAYHVNHIHNRTIAQSSSSGTCVLAWCIVLLWPNVHSFSVAWLYICFCFASYAFAVLLQGVPKETVQ